MNKKKEIKAASCLPEEIYLEIFSRVPARSTYACKCVCKTWLDLISHPSFIKRHLNFTLQKNKPYLMLRSQDQDSAIHTVRHDSEFDDQDDVVEVDYPFPYGWSHEGVSLLGSCNGLVALCYAKMNQREDPRDIIRIWNPVTREFKLLPQSPHRIYADLEVIISAFGYDDKIDDYKLAIVVKDGAATVLDIYTLGTDLWKSIHQPIPYKFPYNIPGVLLHGDFHWLGKTCGENVSKVIVSFNISEERFKEIHLPKSKHFIRSVGLLEGCICIVANVVDVGIEIWTMQEYGVQESWKKRYVISHELFLNVRESCLVLSNDYKHFIRLVLSISNGEILFAACGILIIYNPEHGTLRESNISIPMYWCENDNYFESLVPIGSDNYYIRGLAEDDEDDVEDWHKDSEEEEEEDDDIEEEEEDDDIEEEDSLLEEPEKEEFERKLAAKESLPQEYNP